jgi:thiol:disulfide interchange protein DsbC
MHFTRSLAVSLSLALAAFATGALAQEAAIREAIAKRVPQLKSIDEVRPAKIPGLYEIRVNGAEIYYTDAKGNYLIQGNLFETKGLRNLTEERINKLTAIKFDSLPFKDAFTIVRGNGSRKLAVFEDPNCGYCKRFERDLQKIDNVTVYMFLYPILGPDSNEKAKALWCSKDKGQAWQDWMLRDQPASAAASMCDTTPLARNVEFGKTYRIQGTPTLLFEDGNRIPGAIDAQQIEKHLKDAKG